MNYRVLFTATFALALIPALVPGSPALALKDQTTLTARFDRAELIVLNLNRGPKSTGAYLTQTIKQTNVMVKELDKALRQVEAADREYAGTRGKKDDRFLNGSTERLRQALKSAQDLQSQLESAREELKTDIQQALITNSK